MPEPNLNLKDEQLRTLAALTERIISLGLTATFIPPVVEGPVVSVYKFLPKGSTKVSELIGLTQDFAVVTASESILVQRLPGESAVGVFVPNATRKPVMWATGANNILAMAQSHVTPEIKVPLALGTDHMGDLVLEDQTLMPHLLIAGSTGGGKSTLENALLASIIYFRTPDEVSLVISDTKGVEFTHFRDAPHLLFPPATSSFQTAERMQWLVTESGRRMEVFAKAGVRNISELKAKSPGEKMPYIVLVIDELADLLTDYTKIGEKKEKITIAKMCEQQLARIAARSRAAGVYIIAATQRPSVDVITGVIKSNFPARIAFRLPSQVDSRTVLDVAGAENLLARGDMLFKNPNRAGLQRVHAPWANFDEIAACIRFASEKVRLLG